MILITLMILKDYINLQFELQWITHRILKNLK